MAAGRTPKPTRIKKLEGTLRNDRAQIEEMTPGRLSTPPKIPNQLKGNKYACDEWKRITAELVQLDMMHIIDMSLLMAYCNEMGVYWHCQELLKTEARYFTSETGYQSISAIVLDGRQALKTAQTIATQFGLTPAARTRISALATPDPESELDKYLKKAAAAKG
jgi:P27 family predicted phage terminase small subunit